MSYDRTIGRLRLICNTSMPASQAVQLEIANAPLAGMRTSALLSVEELRDLRHLIDRALHHAKRK